MRKSMKYGKDFDILGFFRIFAKKHLKFQSGYDILIDSVLCSAK